MNPAMLKANLMDFITSPMSPFIAFDIFRNLFKYHYNSTKLKFCVLLKYKVYLF